ncbi:unnamed protein product [Allacma fusca]|uniref:Uncharacterized protein n=1 Tax=Allacma fusca TaxID=39272 RepID=A0A8J2PM62_9HEXA|nr:unnamed protein product [Allacma fusca]
MPCIIFTLTMTECEDENTPLATTNLFQQDDILYHLFAVLPLKDLLICRLENSNNNYEFGKRFFLSSIYMDHPVTCLFFSLFGPTMKSLKLCIRDEHQMCVDNLEHLLVFQAPFLESLEISLPGGIENQPRLFTHTLLGDDENYDCDQDEAFNKPILPHMKSLRLCNNHGYHEGFLTDLFSATVNLTHLKALLDNSVSETSVILSTLRNTGLHRKLKRLELESIVTESHFQYLIDLSSEGMRLQSLAFTQLHPRYFDKDSLQRFLLSQKYNLEYLSVDSVPSQYYWEDEVNLTLVQMTALKQLTVSGHQLPLPACHLALYDFAPRAVARLNSIDSKLRKMKKKCT